MRKFTYILAFFLISCQKSKEKSYFIFYQETESIAPIEVYLNGNYLGEISEPFLGELTSCTAEKGMIKEQVEPNTTYEVVFKLGFMADTLYETAGSNDCRVVVLE